MHPLPTELVIADAALRNNTALRGSGGAIALQTVRRPSPGPRPH